MRHARFASGRPWGAALAYLPPACSSAGETACRKRRDEPRQARADIRPHAPVAGADGARLRGSYLVLGRRRRVDAQITFDNPIDP